MKRSLLEQVILYDYRYFFGFSLVFLLGIYFLFWRLGSLLPGLGFEEAEYLNSFSSWRDVLNQPLYWPHKLLSLGVEQRFGFSEYAFRSVSAIFAAIGLTAFFGVIRSRFRARIAIVAAGLVATSSWWLGYARQARPEILMPVLVFLLMLLARKVYEGRQAGWLILLAVVVGASLYVPLLPYVVAVGLFVLRSLVRQVMGEYSLLARVGASSILLIMSLPLILALIREPQTGLTLLGLPQDWPGIMNTLANLANNLAELFWSAAGEDWSLRVGQLPLLDLFTAIMLALGLYHLDQEVSRSLAHFVLYGLGALLLLTSLDPSANYDAILIPFVYTLVAAGVVMLFSQWYEIFPRNPVARMTAFLPTVILLASVMAYHHQRYFQAWAGAPPILTAFPPLSQSLDKQADTISQPTAFLVVSQAELNIAEVTTRRRFQPVFTVTSVASAVDSSQPIIFSNQAYRSLDKELKKQLAKDTVPVASPYLSLPIGLWQYTPPTP